MAGGRLEVLSMCSRFRCYRNRPQFSVIFQGNFWRSTGDKMAGLRGLETACADHFRPKGDANRETMLGARGYTLDTLPPLTAAQKANLSRLAALPDSEIDTSDIPELSDAQWQTAVRGRFHKPTKTVVTTRLDSDVLDWLKSQGSGYQSCQEREHFFVDSPFLLRLHLKFFNQSLHFRRKQRALCILVWLDWGRIIVQSVFGHV